MPTIQATLSRKLDTPVQEQLALDLSSATARILGKPEDYVQVVVSDGAVATFAGKRVDDSAFVRVYSIGDYKPEACKKLSAEYAALFQKAGVAPERLYDNFCVQAGSHWGWKDQTFG